MMTITEKAAYIKGLFEGLQYDKGSDEGKLFSAIIDLLDDVTVAVADLDEITEAQGDAIDELADDFYDCDCCDDEECYEVECPTCGEKIIVDADMLDEDSIQCPACGEKLELVFDDEPECEE